MKTERVECPCCGRSYEEPVVTIRSISWSDDCACSDYAPCVSHRVGGEYPPRPDEQTLKSRLDKEKSRRQAEWAKFKAKLQEWKSHETRKD